MRRISRGTALKRLTLIAWLIAPAAMLAVAASLAATAVRATPPEDESASVPPVIRQLIEQARLALARGDAAAAADLFGKAAEHGEYTEAEVGEVRARLWAGQFRHAVAISSVVAGEHPESAEAQALLGYIEDRYGYTSQALQRLRAEQQIHPLEVAPVAAEAEVLIDRHSAPAAVDVIDRWVAAHGSQPGLLRLRTRATLVLATKGGVRAAQASASGNVSTSRTGTSGDANAPGAPTAGSTHWQEVVTAKPPAKLGVPVAAGNGLIVDGGRQVITLRRLLNSKAASVWVRNARGELRQGTLRDPTDDSVSGTATLLLETPFPADQSFHVEKSAHRGLCFGLGFPAALSTDAMLPALTPCFASSVQTASRGAVAPPGNGLQLNIPLSAGEAGTPIFDSNGHFMGIADPADPTAPDGEPRGLARLVTLSGTAHSPQQSPAAIAMPELYERLAPAVVQVFVFAPD